MMCGYFDREITVFDGKHFHRARGGDLLRHLPAELLLDRDLGEKAVRCGGHGGPFGMRAADALLRDALDVDHLWRTFNHNEEKEKRKKEIDRKFTARRSRKPRQQSNI